MRLVEYIVALQRLADEHGGGLEVEKWMPAKGRHSAPTPELAYARRFDSRRGGPPDTPPTAQFYNKHDNPVQKGAPVIRV